MSRCRRLRSATWAILACAAVSCGGGAEGEDPAPTKDTTTGEGDDASSGSTGEPQQQDGVDVCLSAPARSPGLYRGTLAGADPNGGACGQSGPDVFFRIEVSRRSDVQVFARGDGYEPRIGVFGNDCAVPFDEGGLLCTVGVPGWVSDVEAGTDLYIAVGASVSDVESSRTGAFELDVRTRNVLAVGERCGDPVWGRCENGSTCAVPDDAQEGDVPEVCVAIPGDRCGNAIDVDVDRGRTTLSIEADAVHTDAHHHGCGGERTVERVYRLALPPSSSTTTVRIESDDVLALAARAPTCLLEEEVGCSEPPAGTPALVLEGVLPRTLYLFVELPERDPEASEQTPSLVRVDFEDV